MIDITKVDLIEFVKAVYHYSNPQGLGILHYVEGDELTTKEAKSFIHEPDEISGGIVDMDYVKGRACKFNTHYTDNKTCISDSWYDHTNEQYDELLSSIGFNRA